MPNTYGMLELEYDWDNPDTWGDTDSIWERVEREALEGEWYAEHVDMEEDYFDDEADDSES
jgi:hypothetical protein